MGGIIKHIHSIGQHYSTSQIKTQNWRSIQLSRKEKEKEGLYITLPSCLVVFVSDFSIEDLHEINYCNKTITKLFMFSRTSLLCGFCRGSGFRYWIDEMTGNPTDGKKGDYYLFYKREKFNFNRNPKGEIVVISNRNLPYHKPCYNSTPYITEGQVICKYCCGSGLHLADNLKIQKRIYTENC